jgi:hypothetical protein
MTAYYAIDVFPWVYFDKAITLEGFLRRKNTNYKGQLAEILNGNYEQLFSAFEKMNYLRLLDLKFSVPVEMKLRTDFALTLLYRLRVMKEYEQRKNR